MASRLRFPDVLADASRRTSVEREPTSEERQERRKHEGKQRTRYSRDEIFARCDVGEMSFLRRNWMDGRAASNGQRTCTRKFSRRNRRGGGTCSGRKKTSVRASPQAPVHLFFYFCHFFFVLLPVDSPPFSIPPYASHLLLSTRIFSVFTYILTSAALPFHNTARCPRFFFLPAIRHALIFSLSPFTSTRVIPFFPQPCFVLPRSIVRSFSPPPSSFWFRACTRFRRRLPPSRRRRCTLPIRARIRIRARSILHRDY